MESSIVIDLLRTGATLSFDSLISEWDRAGFLYTLAGDLTDSGDRRAKTSREFLQVLIDEGITSTLESFVLLYPNGAVRWILANLLVNSPRRDLQDRLVALAENSRCDPRIAELILSRAGRANAGNISRQGPIARI